MNFPRRQFLGMAAATTALLMSNSQLGIANNPNNLTSIKPKRLKPGDGVGLISPAGATFIKDNINIVIDAVKALGLVPYFAPHLLDVYGYLGGKDLDRAQDVNQFFADPKIAMLLPIAGGWGCSRVLPYLDYDTIRKNPKIVVGFSDITALIVGIYAQTGLITFHGPNGLSSWRTEQTEIFRRVLFSGEKVTFKNQLDADDSNRLVQVKNRIQTITAGKAKGRLIGGNLSVFSTLVGSPYLPNLEGAILFLEEVRENIYRVDRWLTHLKLAGVFEKLSGFIFGQCVNCLPDPDYGSLTLEQVLLDHIKSLNIPAFSGAQIGHLEIIKTLPIGGEVEIDATTGTIKMLDSAVI